MLKLIKRLLAFSGENRKDFLLSFAASLLHAMFEAIPAMAVLNVLISIIGTLNGTREMTIADIWIPFGIMLVSVIGKIITEDISSKKRTLGSFSMCAQKRLEIGEMLKRVPMGYFNQNRLGDITATVTTTLGDIETNAVSVLSKVAGGLIYSVVIITWLFIYEWHIGLISLIGLLIALLVYGLLQRVSKRLSPQRQNAQVGLVTAFLEYIQGMAVVKAFGLGDQSGRAVDKAIDESCAANTKLESVFSSLIGVYQSVFKFTASAVLVVAPALVLNTEITLENGLLLVIASFMIYSQMEIFGSASSLGRVIEASLDKMDFLWNTPLLDENGQDIQPGSFDIKMDSVSFSYGKVQTLKNISFNIPQKTTTAIVGPSGSGKTTLCNLIARFWDVQKGQVLVGGVDVREYTCDSLLRNFSMVFQNVYLFEDTIANNIRFGKPGASMDQVIEAAKKAQSHDFISSLPDGYNTLVGEGGSSLSGGEKQRISIARAILKDAPIVILDEATASVDPENEAALQSAIEVLTRNKTRIMIAHRLSTVRSADQILVLDKGEIVQRGTHAELSGQEGVYKRFISIREEAISWTFAGTDS
ncbi:MAG: ABC transporter ATP-binding protein [Suipraeoptans sp.]